MRVKLDLLGRLYDNLDMLSRSCRAAVHAERDGSGLTAVRDVVVMTRRNLVHIAREPLQLSDVTVQPVLFTVLFVYVFGSGILLPGVAATPLCHCRSYGAQPDDISHGDRGRTEHGPQQRSHRPVPNHAHVAALRARRAIARYLAPPPSASSSSLATGLAIGWRPQAAFVDDRGIRPLPFLQLCPVVGLACLGMSKGPESAQGIGLVILFPLAIVSNALVPTEHMPPVLRFIADWNPVSAVTAAAREMFKNPNPSAAIQAWPMQHPLAASLLWCVALFWRSSRPSPPSSTGGARPS